MAINKSKKTSVEYQVDSLDKNSTQMDTDANLNIETQMSLYDYEDKYVRRQNAKLAKYTIKIGVSVVGLIILTCMFFVAMRFYDFSPYITLGVGIFEFILFIFIYIVPVSKILKAEYFETNVNSHNVKNAQKHNRELRNKIADKMIDLTAKVEGVGWYGDELVGKLAIARNTHNNKKVKEILTQIYSTDVKRSAKKIIVNCSVKSGLYSAISQSNKIDAGLVAMINLQMIKDIVFLYGFRPSDTKLLKIFSKVLRNAFIAYGIANVNIGSGVAKTVGDIVKSVPILGSAISVLVDSSVQGLANGTLTAVIGYQTIDYMMKEYKLQDILDNIEIGENESDLKDACAEIESELKKVNGKTKAGKLQPQT